MSSDDYHFFLYAVDALSKHRSNGDITFFVKQGKNGMTSFHSNFAVSVVPKGLKNNKEMLIFGAHKNKIDESDIVMGLFSFKNIEMITIGGQICNEMDKLLIYIKNNVNKSNDVIDEEVKDSVEHNDWILKKLLNTIEDLNFEDCFDGIKVMKLSNRKESQYLDYPKFTICGFVNNKDDISNINTMFAQVLKWEKEGIWVINGKEIELRQGKQRKPTIKSLTSIVRSIFVRGRPLCPANDQILQQLRVESYALSLDAHTFTNFEFESDAQRFGVICNDNDIPNKVIYGRYSSLEQCNGFITYIELASNKNDEKWIINNIDSLCSDDTDDGFTFTFESHTNDDIVGLFDAFDSNVLACGKVNEIIKKLEYLSAFIDRNFLKFEGSISLEDIYYNIEQNTPQILLSHITPVNVGNIVINEAQTMINEVIKELLLILNEKKIIKYEIFLRLSIEMSLKKVGFNGKKLLTREECKSAKKEIFKQLFSIENEDNTKEIELNTFNGFIVRSDDDDDDEEENQSESESESD